MKVTSIVRHIDDLGRVVIPKEIRRTMRIREGDPLEIYTDKDGEVIFKKNSMMISLSEFAGQICETVYKSLHQPILITDRDSVIALPGLVRREWLGKPISPDLESVLESRQLYQHLPGTVPFLETESKSGLFVNIAAPIIAQSDVLSSILLADTSGTASAGETERTLLQIIAGFLGRHMES